MLEKPRKHDVKVNHPAQLAPVGHSAPPTTFAPLAALCAIARFHQVAADPATLAHQLGLSANQPLTKADLIHAARHLGLKAKLSRTPSDRLSLTPLPALALMHSGPHAATAQTADNGGDHGPSNPSLPAALHVVILAQSDGQCVLFQDPSASFGPGVGGGCRPKRWPRH